MRGRTVKRTILSAKDNRLFLILCSVAEAFLLARPKAGNILFALILILLISLIVQEKPYKKLSRGEYLIPAILQAIVTGHAIISWTRTADGSDGAFQIQNILKKPGITAIIILVSFLGFFFMVRLTAFFLQHRETTPPCISPAANVHSRSRRLLISFLYSLLLVTVCSECSFLYPLNEWTDANCFMTVGKSMMHGIVPYRDLFEQKGPYFYLLYGFASLISSDSFLGVYILEILSGTVFLYYASRIISLYSKDHVTDWAVLALFATIVFSSSAFYCGGSTEEFSLPLLTYALYIGLRSIKTGEQIRSGQWIVIGISVGLILWSKYTLLGFYAGWMLYFMIDYLKDRRFGDLGRMILWFAAGIVLTTIPVILYFSANHALKDLYEVYFYDNIFLYSHVTKSSFLKNLIQHFLRGGILIAGKNTVILLLVAALFLVHNHKPTVKYILLSSAFLFVTSFFGKWTWAYYTLTFAPFGCIALGFLFARTKLVTSSRLQILAICVCLAFSPVLTPNQSFIGTPRKNTVQYKFASIINKSENPTLLNYGFLDGGFYQAAGILPDCKAFCKLASPIPEMKALQKEYLKKAKCEFVVSVTELNTKKYKLVKQSRGYYLYQRIGK